MLNYSLKALIGLTAILALASGSLVLLFANLDTINYPVGVACVCAIPTSPFFAAAAGAVFAYVKFSEPKGEAMLIGILMGGFFGVAISVFCFFLLGHIAETYW